MPCARKASWVPTARGLSIFFRAVSGTTPIRTEAKRSSFRRAEVCLRSWARSIRGDEEASAGEEILRSDDACDVVDRDGSGLHGIRRKQTDQRSCRGRRGAGAYAVGGWC